MLQPVTMWLLWGATDTDVTPQIWVSGVIKTVEKTADSSDAVHFFGCGYTNLNSSCHLFFLQSCKMCRFNETGLSTWERAQAQPLLPVELCDRGLDLPEIDSHRLPATQVSLVKTAHLLSAEGETGALFHSSSGICFSPGVLREQTCCPHCWMRRTRDEKREWVRWITERRAEWWDRSDGLLFGQAMSMAHRQVASFGSTCALIRRSRSSPSSGRHGAGLLQARQPEEATPPR